MKNFKTALKILLALVLACAAVFAFLHRRVIWKAVKGEDVGECPHWHAKFCKRKKAK